MGQDDGRNDRSSRSRIWRVLPVVALGFAMLVPAGSGASASPGDRVDLRVLVINDGNTTAAVAQELQSEGVPYTSVAVGSAATITASFLASPSEAFFDAVVVPNAGAALPAGVEAVLQAFESRFGVREVDLDTFPNATVGLNAPVVSENADGMTATVTPAGQASGFGYLAGTVPFDSGSWTSWATPLSTLPTGDVFTPLVTMPVPGGAPGAVAPIVGAFQSGGREDLVVTTALGFSQLQFRALSHGIITWATRGIHLGYERNYLTFQFDDAFASDATWSPALNCTPGDDPAITCAGSAVTVAMSAADVAHVVQWEQQNGLRLTLAFNGSFAGTPDGVDAAALAAFEANENSFGWLNHGYTHLFQGCAQVVSGTTWTCASPLQWPSQTAIYNEIELNIAAATQDGLTINATEYLSGEYSGLIILPQQTIDNPNFVTALTQAGIATVASDASREPKQRQVGSALTAPRWPTEIYYNAATTAQEVSEYNHIHLTTLTPDAAGLNTIMTTNGGYDLRAFALANDPRPFMLHVSNLVGPEYLGLQLIDAMLATYRGVYSTSAYPVSLTLTGAAQMLHRQGLWATTGMATSPTVSAYVQDGVVVVKGGASDVVPVTAPMGTAVGGVAFGQSYAGEQSDWITLPANGTTSLTLPGAGVVPPGGGGGGGSGGGSGGGGGGTSGATLPVAVTRIAGADRIATAIAVSQAHFPVAQSAGAVVLARSDLFVDALAGAPLAVHLNAPLLVTPPGGGLDVRVAAEIGRVVPRGSTVYVLGGTSALGPGVDAALRFLGYQVVRLGGLDRFATAVSIAHDGLADPATDFLVTGSDFADALAAGPAAASVGGAVLLTDGARMPMETAAYLQAHPATLWALGGPAASAAGKSATGVVGVDRYDTAVQVAVRFFPSPTIVGVATGAVPADGLAGGAFMGAMGGPLLLTQPTTLPAIVTSLLGNAKTTVGRAFVFGGPSAIADVAFAQVQAAMAS